jgi:hypothetical protein
MTSIDFLPMDIGGLMREASPSFVLRLNTNSATDFVSRSAAGERLICEKMEIEIAKRLNKLAPPHALY